MQLYETKFSLCHVLSQVLTNATPDMRVFREETFGPAVPLFRFRDEAEAIQLANNSEYGLAAYFYTKGGGASATFRGMLCASI